MEKEHQPDSMATINMKADYAPSEVYSASEPPPAYRQQPSSSVQIARIVALTVVSASFILGSFILASSWVQARASCHQLEQLDAMLDKELALEGRAYNNDALYNDEPLPVGNAHALHAAPPMPSASVEVPTQAPTQAAPAPVNQLKDDGLNLAESKIDEDKLQKIDESSKGDKTDSDESSDSDSSEDEDDLEALRPMFKLPVQFDLDELAGAFLANSQKGRMNCIVERRNEEPMERRFPFNILAAFTPPRPQQGERIAIICHGGDEQRPMIPEPQSQVFAFPLSGPVRLPIRPERDGPAQAPEGRMPPPPFAPFAPHRPPPFRMPMPWESSEEEQNSGPREMRIHVQRVIAIPSGHNMPQAPEGMSPFAPPSMPQNHNDQIEQSEIVHQFIPQPAPTQELEQQPELQMQKMNGQMPMELQWGGLSPEDIQMIQRTAEDAVANQRREQQMDNDMQEVKNIVRSLAAAEEEAVAAAEAEEQRRQEARPQQVLDAPAQGPRAPRTLLLPQEMNIDERPHYVQPRSVRSVDALLHREKRVKRCACDCA